MKAIQYLRNAITKLFVVGTDPMKYTNGENL
jgi:hypothetical protein